MDIKKEIRDELRAALRDPETLKHILNAVKLEAERPVKKVIKKKKDEKTGELF